MCVCVQLVDAEQFIPCLMEMCQVRVFDRNTCIDLRVRVFVSGSGHYHVVQQLGMDGHNVWAVTESLCTDMIARCLIN